MDYNVLIGIDPKNKDAYYRRGLAKLYIKEKDSGCLDLSKAGELGDSRAYEEIQKYCQ